MRREAKGCMWRGSSPCHPRLSLRYPSARASVSEAEPRRVRFGFDEGYFASAVGLRLPYPVPFRLLAKEAEGYLDTEYLSGRIRVSRGNKGTAFVLRRAL